MKLTTKINSAHMIAAVALIPATAKTKVVTKNNSIAINPNTIYNHSIDASYLKPFDTAVIAYQMMGLGNF
ncbi:hypothetical protein LC653_34220 [Nostoc sp. CHAB 5784]|uniref:hypothetical protein n=1 Tax=Nostoc mirabile TaxID=2907820 RepID=UPI001E566F6C|nr:hypothetical protein [Nostoc mirabile]MCC5668775.1 hypothetical protein [Nostoc mirabile CHAB5784]